MQLELLCTSGCIHPVFQQSLGPKKIQFQRSFSLVAVEVVFYWEELWERFSLSKQSQLANFGPEGEAEVNRNVFAMGIAELFRRKPVLQI
jgi:hypothetical protein